MKKQTLYSLISLIALSFFYQSLFAQKINTWIGGVVGRESDWNYGRNWSLGEVPDWSHDVVIPDVSTTTRRYPIAEQGVLQMAKLTILAGAQLTIGDAVQFDIVHFESTCIVGRLLSTDHAPVAFYKREVGKH